MIVAQLSYAHDVPLLIVVLVGVLVVLPVVLVPWSILQRYRAGVARRPARGWVATVNVIAFAVSTAIVLVSAMVSGIWVVGALRAVVIGWALGVALGAIGLVLSRWEHDGTAWHFTPNRWLVALLALVVVARLGYGGWRAWTAWQTWGAADWAAHAGIAGSLGAGALLIGYGLGFWLAVRWRIGRRKRWQATLVR